MRRLKNIFVLLVLAIFAVGVWMPSVQAASQDSNLIKVTVHLIIENPEYFWEYPFSGQRLDGIRVSAMGKTVILPTLSSGDKIEFDVPKGYQFRIGVGFQNGNSVFKEDSFMKRGVNNTNNSFSIILKAPDPQTAIIHATGFDETSI